MLKSSAGWVNTELSVQIQDRFIIKKQPWLAYMWGRENTREPLPDHVDNTDIHRFSIRQYKTVSV